MTNNDKTDFLCKEFIELGYYISIPELIKKGVPKRVAQEVVRRSREEGYVGSTTIINRELTNLRTSLYQDKLIEGERVLKAFHNAF